MRQTPSRIGHQMLDMGPHAALGRHKGIARRAMIASPLFCKYKL